MTLTPPSQPATKPTPVTTVATVKAEPPAMPPMPPGSRPGVLGVLHTRVASAEAAPTVTASASASKPHVLRDGDYMIQVGAFDAESDAKDRLEKCKSLARSVLDDADSFTERVSKRNKTLYRARFAGLDQNQAEAACKHLKRGEIPCFMLKN
jgi:D-alanyl-D-alanine carboxypeptidase